MEITLEEKTRLCALAADERKARDIVVLDVHAISTVADRFLICSGTSDRQVKAIADAISEALATQGEKPFAKEGYQQGTWILMDCGDIVVHVFDEETRAFYDLEHLWHQAPRVEVPEIAASAASTLSPRALLVEEGELL
jgi:ribosome-associated protein